MRRRFLVVVAILGFWLLISPREATRRDLEKFITSDKFHTVKKLGAGEIIETSVERGSIVAEKMVGEVEWPEGCILVARIHGLHASVPGPDDILEPGDLIYAIVTPKVRKQFLKLVR